MPDLCDNNLLIKGSRIEMRKFYNFMGEDIADKMFDLEDDFIESLENEEVEEQVVDFNENEIKELDSKGNDTKKVDFAALFEKFMLEMDDYQLFDKFNFYIDDTPKIISKNLNEILMTYSTSRASNNEFIVYLSKLFPKLIFELEYSAAYFSGAGRYVIKNGDEEYNELCYDVIYFGRDEQYLKYEFSFDLDDIVNCEDTKYVDIIDNNWVKALELRGLSKDNISDWHQVKELLNLTFCSLNKN